MGSKKYFEYCLFVFNQIDRLKEDGIEDILIAYGGMQADPEETDRPIGSLKVISTKNGTLIAKADIPDGKEKYMSALVHDLTNDGAISYFWEWR